MKHAKCLLFILISPTLIFSASISTSANCDHTPSLSSSDSFSTSSCLVDEPGKLESSTTTASYGMVANSVSFSISTASAANFDRPDLNSSASASGSVQIQDIVLTSGPVRPGYLVISGAISAQLWNSDDGNSDGINYTFGGISASCSGNPYGVSCYGPGLPTYPSVLTQPSTILIDLGTGMNLSVNAYSGAYDSIDQGSPLPGNAQGSVTFHFFEADGVTPVDVFSVAPEPATLWMVAGALFTLGVCSAKPREWHT